MTRKLDEQKIKAKKIKYYNDINFIIMKILIYHDLLPLSMWRSHVKVTHVQLGTTFIPQPINEVPPPCVQ